MFFFYNLNFLNRTFKNIKFISCTFTFAKKSINIIFSLIHTEFITQKNSNLNFSNGGPVGLEPFSIPARFLPDAVISRIIQSNSK